MHILVFIFAIPFLGAVIHDLYLNYFVEDEKLQELLALDVKPKDFKLTDLGWVIERYAPAILDTGRSLFSENIWQEWILPVLEQPTIYVAAVPFVIAFILWLAVFAFQKIKTLSTTGFSKKKDYDVYDYAKKESIKYKRK